VLKDLSRATCVEYPRAPCPGCGRVVSTRWATCGREACQRIHRQRIRKAAKQRRALFDLCVTCALRPATVGFVRCKKCRVELTIRRRARTIRKAIAQSKAEAHAIADAAVRIASVKKTPAVPPGSYDAVIE
jgi:hypothetical protein